MGSPVVSYLGFPVVSYQDTGSLLFPTMTRHLNAGEVTRTIVLVILPTFKDRIKKINTNKFELLYICTVNISKNACVNRVVALLGVAERIQRNENTE